MTVFGASQIIGSIVIFLIALMWVTKRINMEEKTLKVISFLIPIIGIIMCIIRLKENKEMAMKYLKVAIIGIVTYVLIIAFLDLVSFIGFIWPIK